MTTQKKEAEIVFVVDPALTIHEVQTPESGQKGIYFQAEIKGLTHPIIARWGGCDDLTSYAAFRTKEEAEAFKDKEDRIPGLSRGRYRHEGHPFS